MKASIVDLRYKMKEVLKALDKNESVTILYHGKEKAVISPLKPEKSPVRITDHPFFGMNRKDQKAVDEVMDELRGGRYDSV